MCYIDRKIPWANVKGFSSDNTSVMVGYNNCVLLDKLTDWYVTEGLTPYQEKCGGHANVGARMLTFQDIQQIMAFITTFAEEFAIMLPGRIPGFKRYDIKLLPLHETKRSVWRKYKRAME